MAEHANVVAQEAAAAGFRLRTLKETNALGQTEHTLCTKDPAMGNLEELLGEILGELRTVNNQLVELTSCQLGPDC